MVVLKTIVSRFVYGFVGESFWSGRKFLIVVDWPVGKI